MDGKCRARKARKPITDRCTIVYERKTCLIETVINSNHVNNILCIVRVYNCTGSENV